IMRAVAAGLAESRGRTEVLIANHSGDHSIYPDCRPEFVEAMAQAVKAGTYEDVKVIAPYTMLDKAEIVRHGARLGIDYSTTYSCYKGGEVQCGTCGTCVERREAMAAAGVEDTTVYLNDGTKDDQD
ncbi:MAG: 7-cyano-7-deazaguanine synthase, partial [Muribaculaceae bacterium]|nr:7-cyano-7-deazaguanine synthase [Muribaculaceae bacterium]